MKLLVESVDGDALEMALPPPAVALSMLRCSITYLHSTDEEYKIVFDLIHGKNEKKYVRVASGCIQNWAGIFKVVIFLHKAASDAALHCALKHCLPSLLPKFLPTFFIISKRPASFWFGIISSVCQIACTCIGCVDTFASSLPLLQKNATSGFCIFFTACVVEFA